MPSLESKVWRKATFLTNCDVSIAATKKPPLNQQFSTLNQLLLPLVEMEKALISPA